MKRRRRNQIFIAALAYFVIAGFVGMVSDHWIRWSLVGSAVFVLLGYMAWSIRNSKKQDWMPSDPPLVPGPDPFLSRQSSSRKASGTPRQIPKNRRPF